ncbi:hypothetical protein SCLCIDRAFT_1214383 [Scleroderma citrinum Foug A]|uniref:Uncharacterized protein n=1 Tax=Scleroderma citrinum Foug A TaxID=1036808 RepID=A0A0C3E5I7_9AGAM|nr:hypothetical protein SCLCIDRAFT_1214383 [Scleroderma citrinum Foug A]
MAIAPCVEAEGAGVGVGDQNGGAGDDGGDGNEGGTMSSGGIDSIRVKAALLVMSSGSPICHANHLYGLVRPRRRCGRIKPESVKVSQPQEVKTAYWICTRTAQPPRNGPKRSCRVIGLVRRRRRCDQTKIESKKLKTKTCPSHSATRIPLQMFI